MVYFGKKIKKALAKSVGLIDWFYVTLSPTQNTSQLAVWPLSRVGSLSCHTSFETGPLNRKDRPIYSLLRQARGSQQRVQSTKDFVLTRTCFMY